MKNKIEKAFTLIELLVVIAIIGILAGILFVAINPKEQSDKAKDIKIKSEMDQMFNQAIIFWSKYGAFYGSNPNGWGNDDIGECTISHNSDGTLLDDEIEESIVKLEKSIHNTSIGTGRDRVYCGVGSDDTWAFAAPLYNPPSGKTGWCVDSSGVKKYVDYDFTSGGWKVGGGGYSAYCR